MLERSKVLELELELMHSKELVRVLVHSKALELVRNKALELVRNKALELVHSKELEPVLVLVHSKDHSNCLSFLSNS